MKPKIVETFLFSEPYEAELLLLKFHLENDGIHEWVILENNYTYQGEKKPYDAEKVLQDERFAPFRKKIKIIKGEIKAPKIYDQISNNDAIAFKVEFAQRELARNYILKTLSDDDYIVIADTDESIDFSDPIRSKEIYDAIETKKRDDIISLKLRRYWYDINNEYGVTYAQTLVKVGAVRSQAKLLAEFRTEYKSVVKFDTDKIVAFEYSHVFPLEHIERKFRTFSHTGYTIADLEQAFRCNHRVRSSAYDGIILPTKRYFFELISINIENSPAYVLDNAEKLRTNHIDPNYNFNRKIDYPEFYTIKFKLKSTVRRLKSAFMRILRE
jgi:23S rRNA U2552 (ribose-2'-O)-methylase RlmE/FtsJ